MIPPYKYCVRQHGPYMVMYAPYRCGPYLATHGPLLVMHGGPSLQHTFICEHLSILRNLNSAFVDNSWTCIELMFGPERTMSKNVVCRRVELENGCPWLKGDQVGGDAPTVFSI